MAGSREVGPALLAGIGEGIAARGSRRQSGEETEVVKGPEWMRDQSG